MRILSIFFVSLVLIFLNFVVIAQVKASMFVISGTITDIGILFDESNSPIVINEFVYNPSSGNEWIELFNKTGGDINLENWQLVDGNGISDDLTLTGTIPANGILVFEKSGGDGWLNNSGSESITLKDNNDQIKDTVSYKNSSFVNGQNIGNVAEDQSICRASDGGANWQSCTNPTKGWFNGAGSEGQAPLLSTIDSTLHTVGIESNIGELINPSSTPAAEGTGALFFEKIGQGKIILEKTLNLSDQATVAVLQSLSTDIEISASHIKFDSETADAMSATSAKVYMYGLNYASTPDIIIKNDTGDVLGTNDPTAVENISYDSDTGILVFNAKHFTQFDLADHSDVTAVADDKTALTGDSIKGGNSDLSNISDVLTNPLPSLGSNGSSISWVSNNVSVVSNDGQIINRPAFGAGNVTVTLTATITKGAASDTKIFTLTVLEATNSAKTTQATSSSDGGGDGLSDGLGCASHDCSVHTETSLQSQISNPTTNLVQRVLGTSTSSGEINTSLDPSPSVLGTELTPTPTITPTNESKTTESKPSNYWWLLIFGVGGLFVVYWFLKRKSY